MSEKGDVPFLGMLNRQTPKPRCHPGERYATHVGGYHCEGGDAGGWAAVAATLDELARAGAQRMIAAALQLEVEAYVTRLSAARDGAGHALVVRNGTARPRSVTTGVGPVTIAAPG
jgi:hypothetical protein